MDSTSKIGHLTALYPVGFYCGQCLSGEKIRCGGNSFYSVFYISGGKGVFRKSAKANNVKEGEALLAKAGEAFSLDSDIKNPLSYIRIDFSGTLACEFDGVADVFETDGFLFSEMEHTYKIYSMQPFFLTASLFKLYFSIFHIKNDNYNYVHRTKEYIDSNYMKPIKIQQLAEKIGLNRKYLSRIFAKKLGITMQQYLIGKRVEESKKLLIGGHTVEEAAVAVGYTDSFAFSKIFKKYTGVSPKNYQKMRLKNKNI